MAMQPSQSAQPTQAEVQQVLNLFNAGQMPQAEQSAKALLQRFPNIPMLHNILGSSLAAQQKFAEAAQSFVKLVQVDPKSPELRFNLAMMYANANQADLAETHYIKATELMPNFVDAHFNLAYLYQVQEKWELAVKHYRQAIWHQPNFAEAYANLGSVLQKQGKLAEAIKHYQHAIDIRPDALSYFNLGTALRNEGLLEDAIASFKKALEFNPNYAEAYSNLGESLWYHGDLNEAVDSFNKALTIDPDNPSANYNLAVFLYDNNELQKAIPHFERSRYDDWQERVLYCLYKTEQFDAFKLKLEASASRVNTSPLIATLSTHYATNFGVPDVYNFCKAPLDYVYHDAIPELAEANSPLLRDLLKDIAEAEISARKQSRLVNGIQSSGNLFKRSEASFQTLAALVARTIKKYYEHYANHDCMFIKAFPKNIEFSSSWYVKMKTGGHLSSHIHEEGWISGAVYLAIPKRITSEEEGCIALSTHGDNYPAKHDNFPKMVVAPKVGDVCFFPSSVFHHTIPFSADEERICIAFDLKPEVTRTAKHGGY